MQEVKQSLVAATTISSAIGCFMMCFLANMPLAIAPGMGINAYFTASSVFFWFCFICWAPPNANAKDPTQRLSTPNNNKKKTKKTK